MNNKRQPQEIDAALLEKISLLEKTPERDAEMAAQTRGKFLAEVDNLPLPGSASSMGWLLGLFGFNQPSSAAMSIGKRKFAFSTIAAALFVIVVLFGGATATAYASQTALPGDALYPVKTSLEQTRISLAYDAYNQAQLHLQFAQRRLNEIKELLAQGRTNDIEFASSEFEHYVQEAMKAAQIVMAADSERGAELNKLVSQALLDYASALKSVLMAAPEAVKPVVEKAMLVSQDGAGDEVEVFGFVDSISETELEIDGVIYSITDLTEFEDFIQPGDFVKLHVIKTQDGAMIIREIELSGASQDNSNESGEENSNDSPAGNENENEDENESDDDTNDNGSHEDSNENELNENGSDNENESDDDSNEDDSNDNHNEDDSEDNHNGGGSSNEDNEDNSNENHNENENESEEDNENSDNSNENSNESEHNENESEDEENKNGDD
jgi:hypothetical protein